MKYLLAISAMAMLLLFGCVSQGENANASPSNANAGNANQQASQQQGGDVKNQGAGSQPGISSLLDLAKSGMMYHCKLVEKSTNLQKAEIWFYYDPASKDSKVSTRMSESGKTLQTISLSKQIGNKLQTTVYVQNPEEVQNCKWLKMTSTVDSDPVDYEEMSLDDYAKAIEVQNLQDYEYAYNCDMQLYSASLFVADGTACDLDEMMKAYSQ